MKVLIVEDDEGKERQIAEVVHERLPKADVEARRSYQSGLEAALVTKPDLILLDMSIPSFDSNPAEGESGGPPLPYGGRDLLREIARNRIRSRVILVTQYDVFGEGQDMMTLDALKAQLAAEFASNYVTTVYYQAAQSQWRIRLSAALDMIRRSASEGEDL